MNNPCEECRKAREDRCPGTCFPRKDYEKWLARHQPCYKCRDRAPGCHGKCEKYIGWRMAWLALKSKKAESPEDVTNYFIERSHKAAKAKHRKEGDK